MLMIYFCFNVTVKISRSSFNELVQLLMIYHQSSLISALLRENSSQMFRIQFGEASTHASRNVTYQGTHADVT